MMRRRPPWAPSRMLAVAWVLGALGPSASVPARASAQRVVVFDMDGPGAMRARAALLRVLGDHDVDVVPQADAHASCSGAGTTAGARTLACVAAALQLDGFITGAARLEGGQATLEVQLLGADGARVASAAFAARRPSDLRRAVRNSAWAQLGAAIAQLHGAAGRPTGDERQADGSVSHAPSAAHPHSDDPASHITLRPSSRRTRHGDPRVDAADYYVSVGLAMRRLRFTDDLFDALGAYDLGVAAAVGAGGTYYPLRGLVASRLAHLGVEWTLSRALVDDTRNQADTHFATSAWSWHAGLRYEAPVGARVLAFGGVGVGRERFRIEPAGPTRPNGPVESGVPSVRYTFLRLSAGLRVRVVGGLSVGAHAAWRPAIDLGALGDDDWFPRARGNGLEVGGLVGYRVHPIVELRVLVEHRRYVADLRPQPGDPRVAGGSVDTFLNVSLATVVALPSAL
ncbi:MAG: hypothetical protein R3B40_22780 [Polyangiales bacterium]